MNSCFRGKGAGWYCRYSTVRLLKRFSEKMWKRNYHWWPRIPFFSFTMKTKYQCFLKYCISRSCFRAAAKLENVPRFLRLLVLRFFFLEYNRYCPDRNLRIMTNSG